MSREFSAREKFGALNNSGIGQKDVVPAEEPKKLILSSESALFDDWAASVMPRKTIDTGFPGLNALLDGGIEGGYLYIQAARPAAGKTTFAAQLACHVAQRGSPVIFITCELAVAELRYKLLTLLAEIEHPSLRKLFHRLYPLARLRLMGQEFVLNDGLKPEMIEKLAEAIREYKDLGSNLFFVDQPPIETVNDIINQVKEATKKVPVVIIDHLHELQSAFQPVRDRRTEVEMIVKHLRDVGKHTGAAIWLISACNRENYGAGNGSATRLSAFRESGMVEFRADVCMFLENTSGEDLSDDDGSRKLIVVKNRRGRCGEVSMNFDFQHCKFSGSKE